MPTGISSSWCLPAFNTPPSGPRPPSRTSLSHLPAQIKQHLHSFVIIAESATVTRSHMRAHAACLAFKGLNSVLPQKNPAANISLRNYLNKSHSFTLLNLNFRSCVITQTRIILQPKYMKLVRTHLCHLL